MAAGQLPVRGVVSLLFILALAGCAGTATTLSTSSAAPSAHPTVVEKNSGTGGIEGTVTDDEVRPIAGAEVAVASRNSNSSEPVATLSSDQQGRFTVKGLEAGPYILYARKLGYFDPPAKPVEVADGQTRNVTLVLRPLPSIVAFHNTTKYSLDFTQLVCARAADNEECGAYVYSGGGHVKTFAVKEDKSGDLATLVAETWWADQIGATPAYFRTDAFSPEQKFRDGTFPTMWQGDYAASNPYHWSSVPQSYKSPTRLLIQRDGAAPAMRSDNRTQLNDGKPLETDGNWVVTVDYYPPGVGSTGVFVVTNQAVEVDVTQFFVDPAPDDWSVFPK